MAMAESEQSQLPRRRHVMPSTSSDPQYPEESLHSFGINALKTLSIRRLIALAAAFLVGFAFTVIMKREQLVWLLATTTVAMPLLQYGQGSTFDSPGLRFGPDRKFRITIFEDLHFGEDCWGDPALMDNDRKTLHVMDSVLDKETTNLVVLNGDLLTGEAFVSGNYTSYIDRIVDPLIKRQLPWASTYGNHDRTKITSPTKMLKQERFKGNVRAGRPLAWTQSMVQGADSQVGTSNYFVPIYASTGGGNPKISMILWFFDSRAGSEFQKTTADGKNIPIDDFVDKKVVKWFQLEKKAFQQQFKRVIPSLAFVHIPVQVTRKLQGKKDTTQATRPGLNDEVIGHQANDCDSFGQNCTYNRKDSAFVQELAKTEGLMAVFSGHDHGIDWCMKWNAPDHANKQGIHLCFGRHTGYGGYGKQWKRGARLVSIDEDLVAHRKYEMDTWIRLEDGSVSGHVMLNSTYGQDEYSSAIANSMRDP